MTATVDRSPIPSTVHRMFTVLFPPVRRAVHPRPLRLTDRWQCRSAKQERREDIQEARNAISDGYDAAAGLKERALNHKEMQRTVGRWVAKGGR
jgi:hypothetical protein